MSKIARIGNFGQVQSSLYRGRCQRLPELATLEKCSLLYRETGVKDCNLGQVQSSLQRDGCRRLPEMATLDKCSLLYRETGVEDCQNWQLWTSAVFFL